ncbi:unnamed protein product [Cylicostephanus goldi]|uniref:Uncharacterized protein n=1 Tax=Cylicostephanus goldi TaxID=71465 RepID=A0A3P7Q8Z0_CYLGO|nr:unnamed protein product [Cylicostephanus goldi]
MFTDELGEKPLSKNTTTNSDKLMDRRSSVHFDSVDGGGPSFPNKQSPIDSDSIQDTHSSSASSTRATQGSSDVSRMSLDSFSEGPVCHPTSGRTSRSLPQLPIKTPTGFAHPFISTHPWAHLVRPRGLQLRSLTENDVTNTLPVEDYRHLTPSGYLEYKFTKWLFPFVNSPDDGKRKRIPVVELQTLDAAIRFRREALLIIKEVQSGSYTHRKNTCPPSPMGKNPTLILPPAVHGRRPVLYQDFFVPGPDQKELQCITLDQFATNIQSNTRGFDESLVSVKDLVWVWTIEPTPQALLDPHTVLKRARFPCVDFNDSEMFFFSVASFAFVTPKVESYNVLGTVVRASRKRGEPLKVFAAFEGAPDAVQITQEISEFPLSQLSEGEVLVARVRSNISTAIRFSEPPVSVEARRKLCDLIRQTMPCYPKEGILPLTVTKLEYIDRLWLKDRLNHFDSFVADPSSAKH